MPDAPEVYFLIGKRNPTGTLFDFFDEREGRTERIVGALDSHRVNLVVLNEAPPVFSGPPPRSLLDSLRTPDPRAPRTGRFEIRWRDGGL